MIHSINKNIILENSDLVSNLYKSTLFEMKVIDETSQTRLEELVLNFKRDLTISKS
jgi:hypothetical protein